MNTMATTKATKAMKSATKTKATKPMKSATKTMAAGHRVDKAMQTRRTSKWTSLMSSPRLTKRCSADEGRYGGDAVWLPEFVLVMVQKDF